MSKKAMVKSDAKIIGVAMGKYSGMDGAHFGFIAYESGERQFFAGGRCDITAMCLAEAISNMVKVTPGLDEGYIDLICESAKDMLSSMEGGVLQ